ncbi:DNA-binding protein [Phenylobacterium sp.]|uniref:DNA-binding protein n=1 Tax=Phenylobacterium sp. TaxID=1871053 RepID=UPI00301C9575
MPAAGSPITGPLARAARALVQWPRDHVARLSGVEEAAIADFEAGRAGLDAAAAGRLRLALEEGGAVLIDEGPDGGVGVRLKFNRKDVRAIGKWENEGGPVGDDDV